VNLSRPWFTPNAFQRSRLSAAQKDFLLDTGSLTKRLILLSKNNFRVQVTGSYWAIPERHESIAMGIKTGHAVYIREVILYCHDTPYVFARSLFPPTSLRGRLALVKNFGNKSLGDLLFSAPFAKRQPMQLCQISGIEKVLPRALQQATSVWGRRSRFEVEDNSILVSEFFLAPFNL